LVVVVYYFVAVLDGFSRMILAWDLFMTMETWTVGTVVQKAKEQYPTANPVCLASLQARLNLSRENNRTLTALPLRGDRAIRA
jgi:hypothetical protein